MKKILAGILGVLLVVGVVSGSAAALFSATANVNNVAIRAGTAGLEFSPNDSTWSTSYEFPDWLADNVYPGYANSATFYVKNTSSANIGLKVSAQLMSAAYGWNEFKDVTNVWIGDSAGSVGSGYYTLTDWNLSAKDTQMVVPSGGGSTPMGIFFNISSGAGNGIANQGISTDWVLTGTQVSP